MGTTPADELEQVIANPQIPPEAVRFFERLRDMPAAVWFLVGTAVQLVIYPIFSMLGALLGVAIFKRNQPPPPGTVEILPPEPPAM
jgi:phosphoserine phosphatase